MKLLLSLIVLSIAFGVNGAVAPRRFWRHGGSLRPRSHKTSSYLNQNLKHYPRSSAGPGSSNGTSEFLPPRELSSMDFYTNSTVSTLTATSEPHHPSQRVTSRSYHWHKRSYPIRHNHRPSILRGSGNVHARDDSVSRSYTGSENVRFKSATKGKIDGRSPTKARALDAAPTPAPTGSGSPDTTVFVYSEEDFALLLPENPGESISDAESDGVTYCTSSGCPRILQQGFITAAAVTRAPDNSSWIQVTGCIDTSKSSLSPSDDGGQFDVRFPNGAQCTFGGYGASFIEQVEPSANRFCLRCCARENDQTNCNSHQDRSGCVVAVPGTYDFPDKGVSCA